MLLLFLGKSLLNLVHLFVLVKVNQADLFNFLLRNPYFLLLINKARFRDMHDHLWQSAVVLLVILQILDAFC